MNETDNKKIEAAEPILDIRNLVVHYETQEGVVEAVNDLSLTILRGETLGLVGETGAGKTTVALSTIGLLPVPPSHIIQGEIVFEGENLLEKSEKEMKKIRGRKIGMIFQDPMSALNPVQYVGDQIAEVIQLHQKCSKGEAQIKAMEMLKMVGIPETRYKEYPHQFSGGMKQRVVIAIALACEPDLIIADEPTTALDVTIQAQVLELMRQLRQRLNTSMLLITHDFGVVAEMCDRCAVIYAGEIVEMGRVEQIFRHPTHPYTRGLFDALPSLDKEVDRLKPIPGLMANPMDLPAYCSFCERCECSSENCRQNDPKLVEIEPEHFVKCLRFGGEDTK
ncbi:MAG: ABC transporter ATP-binding protein [Oscillospiraceae bacterium]